jgi:regulator of protease activity HflC (stomatin/prohibitin superfamily)
MSTFCYFLACVEQSQFAIIEQCGKYNKTMAPGIGLLNPCMGECVAGTVSTRIQQLNVNCETKTLDNVFVTLSINVQYQALIDPESSNIGYSAFYCLTDHVQQIRSYVYDVIRSAVPKITLDKVFEQKEDIAIAVKQELSKCMTDYGWMINQVLIADIEPDAKVKHAMNEINAAQRNRVAAIDRAEAEKILVVKKAEADSESKYLAGVGIARQRKAISDGLRDSVLTFNEVRDTNPHEIMDLILVTQYFDTLKELGEKSHANTVFLPVSPTNPSVSGNASAETHAIRQGMMEAAAAAKTSTPSNPHTNHTHYNHHPGQQYRK